MPELPEVETVVRDIRPLVAGRRILTVTRGPHRLRTAWDEAWDEPLRGVGVGSVGRRGKWILLNLNGGRLLGVHLGMTGQLTVRAADAPAETHTHLVFALDDGQQLRFRDIRRFGRATLYADRAAFDAEHAGSLGPEPWDATPDSFAAAVRRSKRALKAILLDQRVLAGVGNIYADEALHTARLDPRRLGTATTPAEAERLRAAVVATLDSAIERRGSTIRDYVGGSGLAGGYQHEHRVYGRGGEPCRGCEKPITVVRLAGRSTHFCPACQGGPAA